MVQTQQTKAAPYKTIGWLNAVVVVLGVVYATQFAGGKFAPWLLGLIGLSSVVVLLMFALEVYRLYRDYDRGHLFVMRNATFFIVAASVVFVPLLGLYGLFTGYTIGVANLLLLPVFLWLIVNNLFFVRLDSVALQTKNGFFSSRNVPLFDITRVEESDGSLVISQAEGPDVRLFRAFFFAGDWQRLRERLGNLR